METEPQGKVLSPQVLGACIIRCDGAGRNMGQTAVTPGAQIVLKAWNDPEFKARLLADPRAALAERYRVQRAYKVGGVRQ